MRFVSLLAAAPLLVAAAQPVRLQPTGPWAVDYAAESCRLVRQFGESKTATKLAFESVAPGSMDMLVFGRPLSTINERVSAQLMPSGEDLGEGRVAETATDRQPAILWPNIDLLPKQARDRQEQVSRSYEHSGMRPPPVSIAEQEALQQQRRALATATNEIAIQTRRSRPVILETGSLGPAMAAFTKCSRDSLKDWGVDPVVQEQVVRRVWTSNPDRWLFADDYPREMLMLGKESAVAVRLLVDANGRITKCTPLSHFNEPAFTEITCDRIQERARLQPAELADGTKVPSYFIRRVVFRMSR